MEPPRMRIDEGRKGVDVCALQLGELPVFGEQHRQLVSRFSELLQHGGVRGRPRCGSLDDWELEALEQHLTQLWIRVDVELATRTHVDLLLYTLPLAREPFLERRKPRAIDLD